MQMNNNGSNPTDNNPLETGSHEDTDSELKSKSESIDSEVTSRAENELKERRKLKLLNVVEDERLVVERTGFRDDDEDLLFSNSNSQFPVRLFVETEAVEQILEFVHWDDTTPENTVEQAALMYGRLCEYGNRRWGEVCGIVPANTPNASSVSVEISADEWNRLYASLDEINKNRNQEGKQHPLVVLGWMHTHPNTLDVFFSSFDNTLQQAIMNNDNLFGLVINPHRRIFACFADADSSECLAAFVVNNSIRAKWNFDPRKRGRISHEDKKEENGSVLKLKAMPRDTIKGQSFNCTFDNFLEPMTEIYDIDINSKMFSQTFSIVDIFTRNHLLSQRFHLTSQKSLLFALKNCNDIANIIRRTSVSLTTIAFVELLKEEREETIYIPKLVTLMPIDNIWSVPRKWLKEYYIFLTHDRLPNAAKQFLTINDIHGFADSLYRFGNDPYRFNIIYYNNSAKRPGIILIWVNRRIKQ